METENFLKAYNAFRNGTDNFTRHWLVRNLIYSDGVKECADAGCHWLLDKIATEALKPFKLGQAKYECNQALIEVAVRGESAEIRMTMDDNGPALWESTIEFTDLPEGFWNFVLADDHDGYYKLILMSEY